MIFSKLNDSIMILWFYELAEDLLLTERIWQCQATKSSIINLQCKFYPLLLFRFPQVPKMLTYLWNQWPVDGWNTLYKLSKWHKFLPHKFIGSCSEGKLNLTNSGKAILSASGSREWQHITWLCCIHKAVSSVQKQQCLLAFNLSHYEYEDLNDISTWE